MWSFSDPNTSIISWPTHIGALSPEVHVAEQLRDEPDLVVLVGAPAPCPRGRYGLIGIPSACAALAPGPRAVAQAVDCRPRDGIRILALGYELGAAAVRLPLRLPPAGQPAGVSLDLAAALLVDHQEHTIHVWGSNATARQRLLQGLMGEEVDVSRHSTTTPAMGRPNLVPAVSDAEHMARIERVREHIAAGDIYQANLTRRLRVQADIDALGALRLLSGENPVSHAAYLRTRDIELLSNSMETLLQYDASSRTAATFPIKGTHGRDVAASSADDLAQRHRLLRDPKERAEHVMIVDLVRNDLGRVAVPGSVVVRTLMDIEGYVGVWHGVSTVQATLSPRHTNGDLLQTMFPGGSITGAPKRRAMQLLAELEQEPRGFYTGSIAVVDPRGNISASILIRTLVREPDGWSLAVGGGIVADSQPARELEETWEKIEIFSRVLGCTRRPPRAA